MSTPYLGEIRSVGFAFAPVGWLPCQGQLLDATHYPALYALLGTTYGGDGHPLFALPDLRGRLAVGAGAAPGLSSYELGQHGGSEALALSELQLPAHQHEFAGQVGAASGGAASASPVGNYPGPATSNLYAASAGAQLAPGSLTGTAHSAGGREPHPNIQPSLALNFIICVNGLSAGQS